MSQWDQSSKLSLSLLYSRWRAWGIWLHIFFYSHLVLLSKFSVVFINVIVGRWFYYPEIVTACQEIQQDVVGWKNGNQWWHPPHWARESALEPLTSLLRAMVHVHLPNLTCPFHTHSAVQNGASGMEVGPPPFHSHSGEEQRMAYAELLSSSTWRQQEKSPQIPNKGGSFVYGHSDCKSVWDEASLWPPEWENKED